MSHATENLTSFKHRSTTVAHWFIRLKFLVRFSSKLICLRNFITSSLLAIVLYSQQQKSLINSGIEELSSWISLSRQRRFTEAKYGIGLLSFLVGISSVVSYINQNLLSNHFILTMFYPHLFFNRCSLTRRQHSGSKSHYVDKIHFWGIGKQW